MKKYIRNKNFLPLDYLEEINERDESAIKRLLNILILINIFIFPITLSSLKKYKTEPVVEVISTVEEAKNRKNILIFIEEIDKNITKLEIQNGVGTIETNNIDKIYFIEEENKLKITSISKNKDKKYILGVEI
ncbi:hypothetical protein [Clostridium isatidis]|uniref:Uncharacterized protein n=1 Tax=Clostridium isatidis TaxID=182773 RepID=A0A343JAW7_9CLOT|nr:hypothetical protein [Clostridium isatidis]ASW42675.1 hypothetical protein BEN51_04030 [Clostridium isatidis]NLZ33628.1 hypothetical protein [Clostridiales bacterium]